MPLKKKKKSSFPSLDVAAAQWGVGALRHVGDCHHAVQVVETAKGRRLACKQVKDNVFRGKSKNEFSSSFYGWDVDNQRMINRALFESINLSNSLRIQSISR